VNVVAGTPIQLNSTGGTGATVLLAAGNAASVGGLNAFNLLRSGAIILPQMGLREPSGGTLKGVVESDLNGNTRIRASTGGSEFGIQINANGSMEFGTFPNPAAVPTASGGAFKIAVLTGTTSAVAETVVATGLTTIKGVLASVYHSSLGFYLSTAFADLIAAGRQFYVTFDTSGNVRISSTSDGTGVLTAAMQGQTYNLIIFH
jgi:hypothetical protein